MNERWRPRMIAPPMDARAVDESLNRRVTLAAFFAMYGLVFFGLGWAARVVAEKHERTPVIEREPPAWRSP